MREALHHVIKVFRNLIESKIDRILFWLDPYLSVNTIDSNEDFDQNSIELSPTPESVNQSPPIHIEYPGKKDPNAIQDVEKCLAFYQKIREYFDDDVAAMLLKCCLCYGDCSGKK